MGDATYDTMKKEKDMCRATIICTIEATYVRMVIAEKRPQANVGQIGECTQIEVGSNGAYATLATDDPSHGPERQRPKVCKRNLQH